MKATSAKIIHNSFLTTADTYKKVTLAKHLKTKNYLSRVNLFNNNTGEISSIKYDRSWSDNQNYLYKTFVMDDVRYQADMLGLTPIFITITLPSEYHPYNTNKTTKTRHYNKKYNGFSIEDGAKRLQVIHRHLVNNFKVDSKRILSKYVKVVEPHKSGVAHSHSIIWVDSNHVQDFEEHHNNTIATFGLSDKGQDFKVLSTDETKGTTVYLLKYVMKTLKGEDDVTMGWLTANNIKRVMTNSRPTLSRDIFKRVSGEIPFNPNDKKPYLMQIKEHLIIDKTIVDIKGNVISNDVYVGSNPMFQVVKVVERDIRLVDVVEGSEHEKDYYLFESKYKIKDLVITDLTGVVVYDKSVFTLWEKKEENLLLSAFVSHDGSISQSTKNGDLEEIYYF